VDLKRAVAVLLDTKTGRSTRPLGTAAVAVLDGLPRALGGAYVFPGAKKGTHRVTVRGAWAWGAVRHAAGLEGGDGIAPARLHDLRHSFTTVARGLGYGDHVIAALIGHTVRGGMTSRYGDVPDALVREAADKVAGEIATMLDAPPSEEKSGARVLPIERWPA
jgi:integrase